MQEHPEPNSDDVTTPESVAGQSHSDANAPLTTSPAEAKASSANEKDNSPRNAILLGIGSILVIAGLTAVIMHHHHRHPAGNSGQTSSQSEIVKPVENVPSPAPRTVADSINNGELNLSDRIDLKDKDLLCMKNNQSVKTLNLTGCTGLTDGAIETIVSLPLQTLKLYGTKFSSGALAKLSSLSSLETLNAGGSAFDDADVSAVSHIKTLTELRLPHCPKITAAALKSIHSMTWLQKLALPGDDVKGSLDSLNSLHLILLNLAGDKLSDADVAKLCKSIRTLRTLNLRDNPLSDAVLADGAPLSMLPDLTSLSIDNTPISSAAAKKFADTHKKCKVGSIEAQAPEPKVDTSK